MKNNYYENRIAKLSSEIDELLSHIETLEQEINSLQYKNNLYKVKREKILQLLDLVAKNKLCRLGLFTQLNNKNKISKFLFFLTNLRPIRIIYKKYIPSVHEMLEQISIATTEKHISNKTLNPTSKQLNWIDNFKENINLINDSNGSKFYEKLNLKIAIICDEMYYNSIKGIANFEYLSPDNWHTKLQDIEYFLFVSTWRGLYNDWCGLANQESANKRTVFQIFNYCKNNNVRTIFYSKEDPPSYEQFLDYAKVSDIIFTSDNRCVDKYKKDCNNENVYALSFSINPIFHNPIGLNILKNKDNTILFSGSWMEKFQQRCQDLSIIFDAIINSDYKLKIIDRNFPKFTNYNYPDKYMEYISPAIDVKKLYKLHKLFDWAINVNSVKDSETMFANRVVELQACGVLLFSNYNCAISSNFPNICLIDKNNQDDIKHTLNSIKDILYERKIFAIRQIYKECVNYDMYTDFFNKIGIKTAKQIRNILVVLPQNAINALANFKQQTYMNKEYVYANEINLPTINSFDMIAFFREDYEYSPFYLEDMVNAFKYTNSSYIVSNSYYKGNEQIGGKEFDFVDFMQDKYKSVFWIKDFQIDKLLKLKNKVKLPNGFSIHAQNVNIKQIKASKKGKKYKLSVILPIFNNGNFLYFRSFMSLKKSSIFNDLEIILVDDCSNDINTIATLEHLNKKYENIVLYKFNDKPSGSASRPRNKGIELASAELVCFLDPDDELIMDPYPQMLDKKYDLVISNAFIRSLSSYKLNYYKQVIDKYNKNTFENFGKTILKDLNFLAIRIQSLIIKKDLIKNNKLLQVEGAVGEDTLYSWQLLTIAKNIKFINIENHFYYTENTNSVTNCIGKKYFQMLLKLQDEKIKWLENNNLIEEYMQKRHNEYIEKYVFLMLLKTKEEERGEAYVLMLNILNKYNKYKKYYSKTLVLFISFVENNQIDKAIQLIQNINQNKKEMK